ncbi:hypothetical protein SAMN03080617_00343 [Algoriphagus alkaliphilus]|uniref:Uncharacterized protein n=1 Tax=Algoriphagus alkaliphilus TaxID=279824 RepID=A0A1G5VAP9_9BACT|nr:hypothetical protein [Algoriphagus alkaliphilus]MBA4300885.1 hypothetical protein [Cyclobacterium sp.]SDA42095.1 hypothetical protein SAMN03080617_00343 [Algoriphagus alkaliphilus]
MKFSNTLKCACLIIAFATTDFLSAQTDPIAPVGERDVFFYYSEGKLVNDDRVKILMISQYIYRSKYSFNGYKEVFGFDGGDFGTVITSVTNATSERLEEIEKNEYNSKSKNRFHQIQFTYPKFVQASYGFDKVTCFCPVNSNEPSEYDNTTSSFLFKCREQLIAEYLKKGYKIVLFESDQMFERHRFAKEANLERINPLSGLLYEYYDKGDILNLTRRFQEEQSK